MNSGLIFRIIIFLFIFLGVSGIGYLIANVTSLEEVAVTKTQLARISGGMGILLTLAVGYAFKKIYDLKKLEKQKSKLDQN